MPRVAWFVTALLLTAPVGLAAAAPDGADGPAGAGGPETADRSTGPRGYVESGPDNYVGGESEHAIISNIIFLNRCIGGCTFTKSSVNNAIDGANDDGSTQIGDVPQGQQMMISEFAQSEAMWNGFVQCMREVYGPYDVQIVTENPGQIAHHEAVVAGRSIEIGRTGILGVAPLDSASCQPKNNVISFTFANDHGPDPIDMCWTTAQESAHSFGLDHAFDCSDPLTYIGGCGQKFFRNKNIKCGEFAERPCVCGGSVQNSHGKILSIFGKGTDPAPPVVSVASPQPNANVPPTFSVFVNATDARGVARVELYINGWKWTEQAGPRTTFVLELPPGIPDGVMHLKVRALNDLEIYTDVDLTVTRGAPCTDAATQCLAGQECEAGACAWDPPATPLGESCEFNQQCLSLQCADAGAGLICTESCFGPPNDECPDGFACAAEPGAAGVCAPYVEEETGCCSTQRGAGRGTLLANLGLGAMIGLLVVRRRRRRPAVRA